MMNRKQIIEVAGLVGLVGVATYYFTPHVLTVFGVGWLFIPPVIVASMMIRGLQEELRESNASRTSASCKQTRNISLRKTQTRNISLAKEHIEKIKSIGKYNSNFSASIRDLIGQTSKKNSKKNSVSDDYLFRWLMKEVDGVLLPDNILNEIIDPYLINSMESLEIFVNDKFFDWNIHISFKYDNNVSPCNVVVDIRGSGEDRWGWGQKIRMSTSIISQFLVKNSHVIPLKISCVDLVEGRGSVEFSRSDRQEAMKSLIRFFGENEERNEILREIRSGSNIEFWKSIVDLHVSSRYNMVTIHKQYFENLFSKKVHIDDFMIENLAKKPICDIPLEDMFNYIKRINDISNIIDRFEIDGDKLILFHNYRDKSAIEKLRDGFILLLEANSHSYSAKLASNMIILAKV